jgi:hypothetical protein
MVNSRVKGFLPLALVLLGAGLRFGVFVVNRSFSIDEAAVCRNLIDRSWTTLIGRLDYAQVEPPGFLIVQKSVLAVLGNSEQAFRLFPLSCGIGSLGLAWAVLRRIAGFRPTVLALTLLAINPSLIEYSALAKQYSADVAAALLVLLVAIDILEGSPSVKRACWLGAIGAVAAAFSFTAVFVLTAAAFTCALDVSTTRSGRRSPKLLAAGLWALGAAGGIIWGRFTMSPGDAAYMNWFWEAGFMPWSSGVLYALSWIWHRLLGVFSFTAGYRAPIGWLGLTMLGAWSYFRRGRGLLALVLSLPLLLTLAAGVLRRYPFEGGRVEFFLLPALLFLVAQGTEWWWQLCEGRVRWLGAIPAALLIVLAAYPAWMDRQLVDDTGIKPALAYIKSQWRPADYLYVYHGDAQQFLYYAPRFQFTTADYTLGTCARGSARRYLREVDSLRGRARVWVVLTREDSEAGIFMRYLDALGTRTETVFDRPSHDLRQGGITFASLYDLTDSPRAALVAADRFPLPEGLDRSEPFRWACYGVFTPHAGESSR